MYKAIDVAKYILARARQNGDLVTNLKLQKLLYYAQAWYMAKNEGRKLFEDDIEAWEYGPIVRELYNFFKRFSSDPINEYVDKKDIEKFSDKDKKFMDDFLSEFMDYSASSLVSAIHQDEPWIEAFDENNKRASNIISTDSMYRFYIKMVRSKDDLIEGINTPIDECVSVKW